MRRSFHWLPLLAAIGLLCVACRGSATQYRSDDAGTSNYSDDTITVSRADKHVAIADLQQQWMQPWSGSAFKCWQTGDLHPYGNFSTPAVWETSDTVFTGFNSGCFAAVNTQTGALRWQRNLGVQPATTCFAPDGGFGITSSPALVEEDRGDGKQLYVYVHTPLGELRKLKASDGTDVWIQPSKPDAPLDPARDDYFAWSSSLPMPTLGAHGLVYVGLSSNCDAPFARGGIKAFDMLMGQLVWTWWSEPANPGDKLQWDVGGGVWTGVSSDGQFIYTSTGSVTGCDSSGQPADGDIHNPPPVSGVFDGVWHPCDPPGDQYSIVKINALTGAKVWAWRPPVLGVGDPDFGSGTTLWKATIAGSEHQLVGACNKNGQFYAVDTGSGRLVWQVNIGDPTSDGDVGCLGGAVVDTKNSRVFIAGNRSTSNGLRGEAREVNPATGATIWQQTVPTNALGTGTLNPNGVLAYAGMDWGVHEDNGIFLLDTNNHGALLRVLKDGTAGQGSCNNPTGDPALRCTYNQFAQPVFADGGIWMSNMNNLTWFR